MSEATGQTKTETSSPCERLIHVSLFGCDDNPGTKEQPLKTISAAQSAARAAKVVQPNAGVTVLIASGTYYLDDTLVFTNRDSGSADASVVYKAEPGTDVIISGGQAIKLDWEPYRDGIMRARVPRDFHTDQIFVNGELQTMARYPNVNSLQRVFNGYAADAIDPERVASWKDPRGGYIHAMHEAWWGDMSYEITGKAEDGSLQYAGGWQNNRPAGMHRDFRFVENVFEELDAPGEWFLDKQAGFIYYYPPADVDLTTALVEFVRLKHVVELMGTPADPVRFLRFEGLSFRHASRTFMENSEPILRSDWTVYRGGAISISGAEDCAFADCDVADVGGNAVFVSNYNRRITFEGCHIHHAGANGIAFVGNPAMVRNGITWTQQNKIDELDRTQGPLGDDYPSDCLVYDCLIHNTGMVEKQSAPIEIDIAQSITVRSCSIYDVPRAGINIGDGAWGGHIVEDCDVFDTVLETGDHGAFNSWGRDRFWNVEGLDNDTLTVSPDSNLAMADVVQPITLRHNRWRCDHGWDIDLDDGSSNYLIENNLCLNGGLKNREGYYRTVRNNVIVNNTFHPHVWYGNSQDVFIYNIVFTPYEPIGMKQPWGKEVDFNFVHAIGSNTTVALDLQTQSGQDTHSVRGDAGFVDPTLGDYRVHAGSPAAELGFANFPMNEFGVTRARLKVLARAPQLPIFGLRDAAGSDGRDAAEVDWLGARLKNVIGMGMVSAAGLSGETGVWVLRCEGYAAANRLGLLANDVITAANDTAVDSIDDLLKIAELSGTPERLTLSIWRSQMPVTLSLPPLETAK
ncbi:MAG TPA: PDZ domain-containing protein [Capsulimonadaceae bacterium]|jgi:hypothetical protein